MSRSQLHGGWVAFGLLLALGGCATSPTPTRLWDWLQSGDPEDDNDKNFKDAWSQVGTEGRGSRGLEDDRDPFNKYLRSPKAAAIENNLGIK